MYDEEPDDHIVPCPHCGKDIFDEVAQCPHCQQYISATDFNKQTPTWVIVLIVLTVVSFLLTTLLTALPDMSSR